MEVLLHLLVRRSPWLALAVLACVIAVALGPHFPAWAGGGIAFSLLVLPFFGLRPAAPGRFCGRCRHNLKALLTDRCPGCGLFLTETGITSRAPASAGSRVRIALFLAGLGISMILAELMARSLAASAH